MNDGLDLNTYTKKGTPRQRARGSQGRPRRHDRNYRSTRKSIQITQEFHTRLKELTPAGVTMVGFITGLVEKYAKDNNL